MRKISIFELCFKSEKVKWNSRKSFEKFISAYEKSKLYPRL